MLKPERCWKVGDKTYANYNEARIAASAKRVLSVRDTINELLETNTDREGLFSELFLDALFAQFDIKPKRQK